MISYVGSKSDREKQMRSTSSSAYPSDLTLKQWAIIQPYFPRRKKVGRKRKHSFRVIFNAILYVVRSGCAWRMLPKDYPPYQTVYGYFRKWKVNDLWKRVTDRLRQRTRVQAGRDPNPSAAIIDSQSVKSGELRDDVGYDGYKRIKGRRRHALVDVLGLPIDISVTAASVQERTEAAAMFERVKGKMPRLKKIWADGGYTGPLVDWVRRKCGWDLEIIKPTSPEPGFHVRPWCWIVERTFGWLTKYRRFARDYELTTTSSEALIRIAMIRNMACRLARSA